MPRDLIASQMADILGPNITASFRRDLPRRAVVIRLELRSSALREMLHYEINLDERDEHFGPPLEYALRNAVHAMEAEVVSRVFGRRGRR
ncbi:MAG: hypothetical protein ACXIUZ_01890 [Lysobacteraceae bacterium]